MARATEQCRAPISHENWENTTAGKTLSKDMKMEPLGWWMVHAMAIPFRERARRILTIFLAVLASRPVVGSSRKRISAP